MFPPLLRLFLDEPELLVSHASAYSELFREDVARWQARQTRRLVHYLVLAASLVMALGLGGVALMLHAVTGSSHWLLWAVPVSPLLAALATGVAWRAVPRGGAAFPRVRRQVAEDLELFGLKDTRP